MAPARALLGIHDDLIAPFESALALVKSDGLRLGIEDNNCCYAVATNLVFGNGVTPCSLTDEQATKKALALLAALAEDRILKKRLPRAKIGQLIPPASSFSGSTTTLIAGPPEHWLVKFTVAFSMLKDGTHRAPVMGAIVDVRVGGQGTFLAMNLRVPVLGGGSNTYETLHMTPEEERQAGVKLVYALDDGPQVALLPLYVAVVDDDLELFPATKSSLRARIQAVVSNHTAQLTPFVYGGTGAYSFLWRAWNLSAALDGAPSGASDQTELQLPAGHFHVLLRVTDAKTGYTTETGQIVIVPCERAKAVPASEAVSA